ncbi:MAG: 50S ribosomal protein L39e [Candidatus Lokiarchaeota archaeon]|jgi:large subunit ribosomal protein L39e
MARNKDLPSKLRRGKKLKQNKSVPSWIVRKTGGKVRDSPYSRRDWRNTRLKKD